MNAVAGQAFDVQSVRLAMREAEAKTIEVHMFPASGDFPDAFPEVGEHLRMLRGVPEAPAGELVELYQYEPLEPNEILQHLVGCAAEREPRQGAQRRTAARAADIQRRARRQSSDSR